MSVTIVLEVIYLYMCQQKEEEEKRKQPDVMKTLGEWGKEEREREPTDFEKENPNILMLEGTGDFKNMQTSQTIIQSNFVQYWDRTCIEFSVCKKKKTV